MRKSIDGLLLEIPQEVYDPAEDSFLLAENVVLNKGERVLEVGSGSGYVTLFLAKKFPFSEFFCLDINFQATKSTRDNAFQNDVSCHILNCDLLQPFSHRERFFDVVLLNAPYLPVVEEGTLEMAWAGGKSGMDVINRFLLQLSKVLKKTGRCYLVYSSLAESTQFEEQVQKLQFQKRILDQLKLAREKIFLCEISFKK
ncbi:MAG: HemK2/MTQ2 family protein methyltransferase [Candidatus Heimdallarchaeota archaeon]